MVEHPRETPFEVVAMCASAGGFNALREVLRSLPAAFPVPIVVVQHLDPRHRSLIADLLTRSSSLEVHLAAPGDHVRPGHVLFAPPDHHLLINADGSVSLTQSELVHFVRPSADLLFESVAAGYRDRAIAVVLSGTGQDGAQGVIAIKQVGGTVLAQDEATSAFFGMPSKAIETGCVDFVLPLAEVGPALVRLVSPSTAG
jgi:two-component system, chemotaxis family, protein-glutamate methylesterase/glutaminase